MPKGIHGRIHFDLICKYCGNQFTVIAERRFQRYCSQKCYFNSLIKKVEIKLSEAELGYIAGIVDGEGSICFNKRKYTLTPVVYIANTSELLINWLKQKIPVKTYSYEHDDRRKSTYKKMYSIQIIGYLIVKDLLVMLKPYLIIKRKQGELALKYIDERLTIGSRLSEDKETSYYHQMKELNNPNRQLSMKVSEGLLGTYLPKETK